MHPVDASYFASVCGTEQQMRDHRLDAAYRTREAGRRVNAKILQATDLDRTDLPIYTLPVVFHVVGTSPASVTDAQLQAALQDLQ